LAADTLRRRLEVERSPLVKNPEAAAQVLHQAEAVMDDIEAAAKGDPVPAPRTDRLSDEIGATRALRGVHPVVSLRAATAMFEILHPILLERLRVRVAGNAELLTATNALHESIMLRLGQGAVSYANFLRRKVTTSHREERYRIARELHDHAAHGVGVALQDLELHDVYADQDPLRARVHIDNARTALHEALDTVRQLAQDLRESPTRSGGLEKVLSDYIASRVPLDIRTTISVTGAEHIPDEVCEELYVVLREAIRNVVLHARPRTLEVIVVAAGGEIHATVRDDGQGFDSDAALAARDGVGLSSMRERVELLDGTLTIEPVITVGTTVSIVIAQQESHS
jgi:signal transduction histidine kinase